MHKVCPSDRKKKNKTKTYNVEQCQNLQPTKADCVSNCFFWLDLILFNVLFDNIAIDNADDEYKLQPKNAQVRILPPNDHPQAKLLRYVPALYWIPNYNIKAHLLGDCIAGLTAGVMLIPQGMAYALIAGKYIFL